MSMANSIGSRSGMGGAAGADPGGKVAVSADDERWHEMTHKFNWLDDAFLRVEDTALCIELINALRKVEGDFGGVKKRVGEIVHADAGVSADSILSIRENVEHAFASLRKLEVLASSHHVAPPARSSDGTVHVILLLGLSLAVLVLACLGPFAVVVGGVGGGRCWWPRLARPGCIGARSVLRLAGLARTA